ncbi:DNA mismatch repair endonuclease MutL [Alteribacillus iranensis]|uniref:DNA mismatch repair protein MutL n=1 Tax=Alteribacillus iranensis TaxID=930128 RepID=A0A1I2A1C2_9BACI|nr:DNA mismatch repair endonuclease MutL [Alteribacillus iranensis]SFE37567.1 DNA mismatch repair protein MutL [Alteribacillus iranensis]
MAAITKLSTELSNKIAAGEVVERPASVVKELTENAIDAKSTRISIYIKEGGLSEIKIVDNGIGMAREDAELAFSRHATSKIKTEHDLFRISTLGFRGEALPSIASVANVELETGNGKDAGTLIRYQGGKRIAFSSSKSRQGTEITVRDLFFNTPARLKHMKTIHTELGKITDVVNRLALANPSIAFQLFHNERQLLFTNGNGNIQAVIAAIYGRRTAQQFFRIENSSVDYQIEGFIANPEVTRASRQHISFFINGRYIRHYPLTKSVEQAYHTLLPIGRHPIVVIHIKMDPVLIDVNVHPSKLEVRLSKEKELCSVLEEGIKSQLYNQTLIPNVEEKRGKQLNSDQLSLTFSEQALPKRETRKESPPEEKVLQPKKDHSMDFNHEEQYDFSPEKKGFEKDQDMLRQQSVEPKGYKISKPECDDTLFEKMEVNTENKKETDTRFPNIEFIGQMHGTYILAQNEDGLYIIDQHAAQERIFYEFYREKIGDTKPELQELLVPLTLEFSSEEEMVIKRHQQDLEDVGVYLEPFGQRTYRVRSHPVWFPTGEEEYVIRELLEQLMQDKKISLHKLREEAAILMSCKAAIKANRHLRDDEIQALIKKLGTCEVPFTCPHGRPIVIHFSGYDMEKMFKRIM